MGEVNNATVTVTVAVAVSYITGQNWTISLLYLESPHSYIKESPLKKGVMQMLLGLINTKTHLKANL